MKIIAADTSTPSGSVALLDADQLVAEWTLQSSQTHNRRLLSTVDFLLRRAGWNLEDAGCFAVTTGPGSFTGLRIGLSTFKTLAWSLQKPYVGIPTLDALAAPFCFASHPVCPVLDARKKEVYFAFYRSDDRGRQVRHGTFGVGKPEQLIRHITEPTIFCGDGWLLYRDPLQTRLGKLAIAAPSPFHALRAAVVGSLAHQRLLAGEAEDPVTSTPLYVRPSEAELHKKAIDKRAQPGNNPLP